MGLLNVSPLDSHSLHNLRKKRTVIGITCKDGVILGVEKLVQSKLLVPGSNRRIGSVDVHAGLAHAGLLADGRYLLNHVKDECSDWRDRYHTPIGGMVFARAQIPHLFSFALALDFLRPFPKGAR